jgi:hypothetical protein
MTLVLSSCAPIRLVPTHRCQDGLPMRVLVDVACRDGVCGWTCAPDRWKDGDQ